MKNLKKPSVTHPKSLLNIFRSFMMEWTVIANTVHKEHINEYSSKKVL